MDISEQVLLLAFVLTCLYGVIIAQAIGLMRLLKSWGWVLIAAGFVIGGFRQVWGYVKLPATIMKAQSQGVMPTSLSGEQWLQVGLGILMLILIIIGLNFLRKDFRGIGLG